MALTPRELAGALGHVGAIGPFAAGGFQARVPLSAIAALRRAARRLGAELQLLAAADTPRDVR